MRANDALSLCCRPRSLDGQVEPLLPANGCSSCCSGGAGRLVVVIDDDPLVLDGVGGLLRGWGCEVWVSASSSGTLARLRKARRQPDLIICDYHLTQHGETGSSAIERLRSNYKAPIPALLITGDISVERKQEAEAHGYEILQKPVPPISLRAITCEMLKPRATVDALLAGGAPAAPIELNP